MRRLWIIFFVGCVALVAGSCSDREPEEAAGSPFNTKIQQQAAVENPGLPEMPTLVGPMSGVTPTTLPVTVEVALSASVELEGRQGTGRSFFPAVSLRSGETKTVTIGTEANGAVLTYSASPAEAGVVPIAIRLRLVGLRRADVRWIARLSDGQRLTLHSATSVGDRITFNVSSQLLGEVPTDEPPATRRAVGR